MMEEPAKDIDKSIDGLMTKFRDAKRLGNTTAKDTGQARKIALAIALQKVKGKKS